jgi:hypothetical protein
VVAAQKPQVFSGSSGGRAGGDETHEQRPAPSGPRARRPHFPKGTHGVSFGARFPHQPARRTPHQATRGPSRVEQTAAPKRSGRQEALESRDSPRQRAIDKKHRRADRVTR